MPPRSITPEPDDNADEEPAAPITPTPVQKPARKVTKSRKPISPAQATQIVEEPQDPPASSTSVNVDKLDPHDVVPAPPAAEPEVVKMRPPPKYDDRQKCLKETRYLYNLYGIKLYDRNVHSNLAALAGYLGLGNTDELIDLIDKSKAIKQMVALRETGYGVPAKTKTSQITEKKKA